MPPFMMLLPEAGENFTWLLAVCQAQLEQISAHFIKLLPHLLQRLPLPLLLRIIRHVLR